MEKAFKLDFVNDKTPKRKHEKKLISLLGMIFHRMLTGSAPANKKCTYEGRYESVIRKCLEKNPEQRYQSISELKEDLKEAKERAPKNIVSKTAGIPYALTFPFQGAILAFEWILICFFLKKEQSLKRQRDWVSFPEQLTGFKPPSKFRIWAIMN